MSRPEIFREVPGRDRRNRRMVILALAIVGLVIAVFVGGIVVAAVLSHTTNSANWSTWGNVGQTFESINALFSALAFAAIVITFWFQLKELREQRLELQMQREVADGSRDALKRAAEADMRQLHVQLMKMSMDDPSLAKVWPEIQPGLPPERTKQYTYANLLIQHVRLVFDLRWYGEESVRGIIRYLFSSALIREYWLASRAARDASTRDPQELRFFHLVEETYRELLRANPALENTDVPAPPHERDAGGAGTEKP